MLSCVWMTIEEFGLVSGFIEHLQIVTTRNYSSIANSHTLQFITAHTKSSQSAVSSPVVAWWQITTMSSASVLTFLSAGDCPITNTLSKSKSKLRYDRWSVGQSVLVCQAPIWGLWPDFYYCQTVAGLLMWGALSDERTGLSFTIPAGPRQRSYSWVRVPRDSWPYFTDLDSRLPQPGGPGPRIYSPQEQGRPVILPGTRFPFRHLLLLAGLRWRYLNLPPRGSQSPQPELLLH
jgi:hypothetical protein